MKKKIVIYGDSNTYGYDPRDFSSGRYPAKERWADILEERLKDTYELAVDGMNGRPLPPVQGEHLHLKRLIAENRPADLFICMLGTNDILLTTRPDAAAAIGKMDHFLTWLRGEGLEEILITAPPCIGSSADVYYERYHRESIRMNRGFEELAEKHRVHFADAAAWNIPLAFDQVHIAPAGAGPFAEHMEKVIRQIME